MGVANNQALMAILQNCECYFRRMIINLEDQLGIRLRKDFGKL